MVNDENRVPLLGDNESFDGPEDIIKRCDYRRRANTIVATISIAFVSIALFSAIITLQKRDSTLAPMSSLEPSYSSQQQRWTGRTELKQSFPYYMPVELPKHPVNETLGFGSIFAINLPSRLDRKSEYVLMGSISDIKIEMFPALNVKEWDDKGLPWHPPAMTDASMSSYVSHSAVYSHLVETGYKAALVLEDDNDWDLDVKKSIASLQQAVAAMGASLDKNGRTRTPTSDDPWSSEDWDVIFLSSCSGAPQTKGEHRMDLDGDSLPYIIFPDPAVADAQKVMPYARKYLNETGFSHILANELDAATQDNSSFTRKRMLSIAKNPLCSNAYAVSQQGAKKLLYLSTRQATLPLDVELAIWCHSARLRCLLTLPSIFVQWKIKDQHKLDSDITTRGNNHDPSYGITVDVRRSMRKLLMKSIFGHPDCIFCGHET